MVPLEGFVQVTLPKGTYDEILADLTASGQVVSLFELMHSAVNVERLEYGGWDIKGLTHDAVELDARLGQAQDRAKADLL